MRAVLMGCVLALAAFAGIACHTMASVPVNQLGTLKPSRAWLTMGDQSVIELAGPQVMGDTVVGYVKGEYHELPMANVKGVTVQKASPLKTAGLVASGLVVLGGVAYVISSSANKADTSTSMVDCQVNPNASVCM